MLFDLELEELLDLEEELERYRRRCRLCRDLE